MLGHGLLRCQHHGARPVVQCGRVCRRDRPLTVKSRTQGRNLVQLHVAVFLVAIHDEVVPPTLGHRDGHHFCLEFAFVPCFGGTAVALHGKGILRFARDVLLFGAELCTIPHVRGVVNVGQAVEQHAVLDFDVAKFGAFAAIEVMGYHAHVLHPSGHDQLCITCGDGLGSKGNGLHAARAHFVHRCARHILAEACSHGRLPSRSLSHTRLQHVSHDDLIDVDCRHRGRIECALDCHCTELGGRNRRQCAKETSHGRPNGRNNVYGARHDAVLGGCRGTKLGRDGPIGLGFFQGSETFHNQSRTKTNLQTKITWHSMAFLSSTNQIA